MRGWNPFARLPIVVLAVAATLPAPAAAAPAESLAEVWAGPHRLELQPRTEHGRLVLTVTGPEGFHHRAEFAAGETPVFSIFDQAGGALPDGSYAWELRAVPVDVERRDTAAGGEMAAKGAREDRRLVQSGSFAVLHGALVAGDESEPDSGRPGARNVLGAKDQVISDDLIVQGSICAGFDCVNNESFGFDTLRLKENNTRIQFYDTSSIGAFPTNNWQIRANASAAGGASFLGVVDQGVSGSSESGTLVFLVEAGAPANALRVAGTGRVGLGTATPILHLHAVDGNTPGLRLEQDASSGFA
ncbi:MAG TPA: hypothetical protein VLF66_15070, partial [Thermoanaerobaculia bacterium]|nr:hypothetical protein [Thermoanaerobaculia bacterium]